MKIREYRFDDDAESHAEVHRERIKPTGDVVIWQL